MEQKIIYYPEIMGGQKVEYLDQEYTHWRVTKMKEKDYKEAGLLF